MCRMRVFRTAIRRATPASFVVRFLPFNGIALREDTFLQFSCSYSSASLASQDLKLKSKIEINLASLLVRHGAESADGGQLQRHRRSEGGIKERIDHVERDFEETRQGHGLSDIIIISPLLADTRPAVAHVPKLFKQIGRMNIYIYG